MAQPISIRFAVIGLNHYHIYQQVDTLLSAGGTLVSFFAPEDELAVRFSEHYPYATRVSHMRQVLEDETIQLIAGAGIPEERAAVGVAAMHHGKDYYTDKPGFTTLDQVEEAKRAHEATGHLYYIAFGRLDSPAMHRAGELVQAGAIGRPLQTLGLGPHRINAPTRPAWFFQRARYGGIITDLGSHQVEQFLFFTGSTTAEIVAAQVANHNHPEHPELEDFGDAVLRGDNGTTGYLRVDWFTPDGLESYGDQRLMILGTDGYLEVRGNCDLVGRPDGQHLFLVDHERAKYIDCRGVTVPSGTRLLDDAGHRTQTLMTQAHCFQASTIALQAQAAAQRVA